MYKKVNINREEDFNNVLMAKNNKLMGRKFVNCSGNFFAIKTFLHINLLILNSNNPIAL